MEIFGILNITPDSFSDGGENSQIDNALENAEKMLADGAFVIDIGAESTRPDATPLTYSQEWARLEPVLEKINQACIISIDTRNPETAENALNYPQVKYINDVSGFENPEMARVAREKDAKIIVMHSLTVPADRNITLTTPPVNTISDWAANKLSHLKNLGFPSENVIIDIGIGFGKTAEQSLELIRNIKKIAAIIHETGAKLMVGHSRKSFLSLFTDKSNNKRDFETAVIAAYLQSQNVDFVRVHNVRQTQQAMEQGGALFQI